MLVFNDPPAASCGSLQYGSSHSPELNTIMGLAITLGTGPNPTPGLPWVWRRKLNLTQQSLTAAHHI
jgi:hypothetical protein